MPAPMQEFSFQVFEAFTAATLDLYRHQYRGDVHPCAGSSACLAVPGYIGAAARAAYVLRPAMFRNFDFDVIARSLPYLFYDGMTFTLTLTALATAAGLALGTLLALARLSSIPLAVGARPPAYVNLMRSVPLVLMIFWFYFLVPYIGPMDDRRRATDPASGRSCRPS